LGTISTLSSGKYQANVIDKYGTRLRLSFDKKKDAQAFITRTESEKEEQRLVSLKIKLERTSIKEALNNFLNTKSRLRQKSIQKYNNAITQLGLFCSNRNIQYIQEFTPAIASELYNLLIMDKVDPTGNTKSIKRPQPKTVNFYLETYRSLFKSEIQKDNITRNPFSHVTNLKVEKKPPEYYTIEEVEKFFEQNMNPANRNAFLMLLHTGMRFAELANLRWEDIDFKRRVIKVTPKEDFNTKTDNSIRAIPMNSVTEELLKLIYSQGKAGYVVCSPKGSKLRERTLLQVCKNIGQKAGISGRIFLHKWRHTYATHLVKNRTPIEAVSKLLGHSSLKETMVYAHFKSDDYFADVETLSNTFKVTIGDGNKLA
jgi:site-specific recombinase XerD